jgi:hypothetical protein
MQTLRRRHAAALAPAGQTETEGEGIITTATQRPDPRGCVNCRTTEASCDTRRLFRGDPWCNDCDHEIENRVGVPTRRKRAAGGG